MLWLSHHHFFIQDLLLEMICLNTINQDNDFVAGFVRLSFHDCVGGCDGCIDIDLTDSSNGDIPNAGNLFS